jgi:DNA repair exonuclease SbcCD nuclease subunit
MKILHLSDFHLGHRCYGITRRQEALRKNFSSNHSNGLVDIVLQKQPDVILLAGDLFDNSSPTYDDLDTLRKWIDRVKKETHCEVIGITGNHDKLPDSWMQVSEFLGIHNPGEYGGLNIQCSNHMYRTVLREYADSLEGCDILMLHQSMCGFLASVMRPEIDEETARVLASKCSYLALGDLHIHNRMQVDGCIVAYPGPIDFLRIGECSSNQFGGWLIEDDGNTLKTKSVSITPYQETYVYDIKDLEQYDSTINKIEEVENAFFVIRAIQHDMLEVLKERLVEKRDKCSSFCFCLSELESKEKRKDPLEEASDFDEDFMNIIRNDNSIEESDKKLATDLWGTHSPKGMQALLSHDLKDIKEEMNKDEDQKS